MEVGPSNPTHGIEEVDDDGMVSIEKDELDDIELAALGGKEKFIKT